MPAPVVGVPSDMSGALLASAFAAGLVATVNPCGFAMLPAYLSFFLGAEDDDRAPMGRALSIAGMMTLSFLVVFGAAGVLLALGVRTVIDAIPWLALVVGVGVAVLGVYVMRGGVINLSLPGKGTVNRNSVFLFGGSYAIASLSCTLPIFLSLVVGTIATAVLWQSVLLFLVYALGMALVIGGITVGLALGKDRIVRWMRGAGRWMPFASGLVLSVAGVFIIWYWATVLGSGSLALADNGLVRWIDTLSATISTYVRENLWWTLIGLLVAIGGGWLGLRNRGHPVEGARHDSDAVAPRD